MTARARVRAVGLAGPTARRVQRREIQIFSAASTKPTER
jgi:hypothetical protein